MWLSINEADSKPIYLQIISQVREQVRSGALKPGDELPSVRELADNLGINMHTVRSAYLKLRDQGIINLHLGRRATISRSIQPITSPAIEAELHHRLEELLTDALLMGLSEMDIHKMVDTELKQLNSTDERG
jgi:GntR family transcriptional regulator